jgi:hypothetical protein
MAVDPMRFRKVDGETVVEGRIGNPLGGTRADRPEMTTVVQLPPEFRPAEQCDFEVTCETGKTTVRVLADGQIQADPNVGWIDLRGVRFSTHDEH